MGKLLEELRNFLSTATPEQLEQAWKEVEQFEDVGPTITEYIESVEKVENFVYIKPIDRREYKFNLHQITYVAKLLTEEGKPCLRIRTSDGRSFTFIEGEDIENVDKEFNKF